MAVKRNPTSTRARDDSLDARNQNLHAEIVSARTRHADAVAAAAAAGVIDIDDVPAVKAAADAVAAAEMTLVEANRGLALSFAKKFASDRDRGQLLREALTDAESALWIAVRSWDPDKATLANWARKTMSRPVNNTVRISEGRLLAKSTTEARPKVLRAERILAEMLERRPTDAEITAEVERAGNGILTEEIVRLVRGAEQAGPARSLDAPSGSDDDRTLGDRLSDDDSVAIDSDLLGTDSMITACLPDDIPAGGVIAWLVPNIEKTHGGHDNLAVDAETYEVALARDIPAGTIDVGAVVGQRTVSRKTDTFVVGRLFVNIADIDPDLSGRYDPTEDRDDIVVLGIVDPETGQDLLGHVPDGACQIDRVYVAARAADLFALYASVWNEPLRLGVRAIANAIGESRETYRLSRNRGEDAFAVLNDGPVQFRSGPSLWEDPALAPIEPVTQGQLPC